MSQTKTTMSSSPELSRVRSKPSTTTTTALMLTYRPIIFLLFGGPIAIMSLPIASWLFRSVFGALTNQHSLLTIGMTIVLSKVLERAITNAAPTKEIGIQSVERSRGLLFLAAFVGSILVIRILVTPLENLLGLSSILKWSPSISVSSALRLASGAFLLGLSIVARYIGPQSIVRCSSSPLLVNPYVKAFRSIFESPQPLSKFPETRQRPGDFRRKEKTSEQRKEVNPRRMQLPTSASLSAQIVISIALSTIFAFNSILPFAHDAADGSISLSTKTTIFFSCIASGALQLLLTTIQGTNHEINPLYYQSNSTRGKDNFFKSLGTAAQISVAVPILAIFVQSQNDSSQWSDSLFYFVCVPPVIILYLYGFDYALRILLCTTPPGMKKFVEEASGGDVSMEIFVDVILRSVLHSNDELVKKLGNLPTASKMWTNIEEEELKLSNAAMKTMANTLLYKTNKDEASPHLEDDVLRLAILSCVGGTTSKGAGTIGNAAESNMKNWLRPAADIVQLPGKNSIDPFAIPIVRALCVYAGGIAESLRLIFASKDKQAQDLWVLPPGTLFMAECAIRGATHWILQGMSMSPSGTSLSILIPVLLNSAYKLQDSLLRYQQASDGSAPYGETYSLKLTPPLSPQFLPLYNICNNSAKSILETAKANEKFRQLDFFQSLDADCRNWLRSKMIPLQ